MKGTPFRIGGDCLLSAGLAAIVLLVAIGLSAKDSLAQDSYKNQTIRSIELKKSLGLEKSYALVIGNNQYSYLNNLNTAISDASAISELLKTKYDFDEIQLLINAKRGEILEHLNLYRRKLDTGDRLLIYYAGHGYYDRAAEQGYWLPIDAKEDTSVNWLSNASITDVLRATLARQILVIADSCFSGALTRGTDGPNYQPNSGRLAWFTRAASKRSRTALVSGGLEPVTDGGRNGHSVFASALLDILRENDGLLDGVTLFNRLKGRVVVNADQTPTYGIVHKAYHEGGDFIFVPRTMVYRLPVTTTPVTPSEGETESRCFQAWKGIQNSQVPTDFAAFVNAYPDCPITPIARSRQLALENKSPANVEPQTPETDFIIDEVDEINYVEYRSRVRSEPNTNSTIIKVLPKDEHVRVTGKVRDRNWSRIAIDDTQTGFIWSPLLKNSLPEHKKPSQNPLHTNKNKELPAPGSEFRDCDKCPVMVVLPTGSFLMGSTYRERVWAIGAGAQHEWLAHETPQRNVHINYSIAVSKYEITRELWEHCASSKNCDRAQHPKNANFNDTYGHPITNINWNDAKSYTRYLETITNKKYRLLTEAEWEYATRALTTTPFSTGIQILPSQANFDHRYTYNNSKTGKYRGHSTSVGSFPKNAFGLFDMHGNVWEWVEDCYHDRYNNAPTDGSAWVGGNCSFRVLRGGSWFDPPKELRSAARDWGTAGQSDDTIGFRVAYTLEKN